MFDNINCKFQQKIRWTCSETHRLIYNHATCHLLMYGSGRAVDVENHENVDEMDTIIFLLQNFCIITTSIRFQHVMDQEQGCKLFLYIYLL